MFIDALIFSYKRRKKQEQIPFLAECLKLKNSPKFKSKSSWDGFCKFAYNYQKFRLFNLRKRKTDVL